LFQKIEDEMVETEVQRLHDAKKANLAEKTNNSTPVFDPQKPETSFDEFQKMDIRLGTILEAEKVKKADKLLKLLVDTGLDKRVIVSGIAEHYTPEEVIGKTVTVLMNLAPRTIKGIESQGMILMAENENNELSFMIPEKAFKAGCGIH